jgi:uncharacterized secreted protein with C-terminal beta-propeller domain
VPRCAITLPLVINASCERVLTGAGLAESRRLRLAELVPMLERLLQWSRRHWQRRRAVRAGTEGTDMTKNRLLSALALLTSTLFLPACGSSSSKSPEEDSPDTAGPVEVPEGVYESAHPGGASFSGVAVSEDGKTVVTTQPDGPAAGMNASQGAPAGGSTGNAAGGPVGDTEEAPRVSEPSETPMDTSDNSSQAARAIEEADIIKLSGDRLYALSTYGGLSVVDVSNPDKLSLLGRYRTTATPFEMYVRDESVFVLYNGYGEYEEDPDSELWTFYQTSYVIALDAGNPEQITEQQRFEIQGYIADSRLIGDVMYVVAFDDSYCYRCGSSVETNVMSLDVKNPEDIEKVDELTFEERDNEYSWQRSLSATDERLYIAGPNWGGGDEPQGSTIQVVDIAAADGDMVEGDRLEVAGQINSRWQMDEYDGVLRVISQPLWWRSDGAPHVETYTIESSDQLAAIGDLELVLPRPETLQAVRFDGSRAYAITFEQTDPLFTIDLSEPSDPRQVGELQMPGWLYYMEPRGERLIGLGFDQGNADGSLTVSIFDVSDLSTPTMIDRVNFGGDWAQLAEDQDRIHKSFQVLDEQELILVPFSGWYSEYNEEECYERNVNLSGVQLIDWSDDTLALRGVAESSGQARRGFFVKDRLLVMSDERLEAFNVDDRDEPESTSLVDLAQIVNQVATAGDTVVRVGNDWWNGSFEATVSSLDDLTAFRPGTNVDLSQINRYDCDSQSWLSEIMSGDDRVYFLYNHYDWSGRDEKGEETKVLTLDVSDPDDPKIAGDAGLGLTPSYGRSYVPGMVDNGVPAISVGDSLVFAQHNTEYNDRGFITRNDYTLEVVDFADPSSPTVASVLMPDSLGSTGLVTSGNVVATSHFETSPINPASVRFYLDRVDISKPAKPELLEPVNIPGSLLAYDHDTSRALSVDYQYVVIEDISPKQCYEEEYGEFQTADPSRVDYEAARGPCLALRYRLELLEVDGDTATVVDSYEVDKGVQVTAAALGDDRVFLGTALTAGYYAGVTMPGRATMGPAIADGPIGGGVDIRYYSYSFETAESKLLVVSGLGRGELVVAPVELETTSNFYGFSGLLAKGTKAVVATGWEGRLSVIDADDPKQPKVQDSAELGGYVQDLDLAGDVAIAALGQDGVQTISLED